MQYSLFSWYILKYDAEKIHLYWLIRSIDGNIDDLL